MVVFGDSGGGGFCRFCKAYSFPEQAAVSQGQLRTAEGHQGWGNWCKEEIRSGLVRISRSQNTCLKYVLLVQTVNNESESLCCVDDRCSDQYSPKANFIFFPIFFRFKCRK